MPKESLLASMPKLILAVVLIVCVGAVMGLMGYALMKKATVNNYQSYQDVKISEEDIKREMANWQVYKYEDWGFSIKIPQSYTKKEKNVEAGSWKLNSTTFSKDDKSVLIVIDQSENIDLLRADVLSAFNKFKSGEEKEILRILNEFKIDNSEYIYFNKIEKGDCIGTQFIAKNNSKYNQDIVLISLNRKDVYIQISFEYYDENTKLEIAKMIGTIECTK